MIESWFSICLSSYGQGLFGFSKGVVIWISSNSQIRVARSYNTQPGKSVPCSSFNITSHQMYECSVFLIFVEYSMAKKYFINSISMSTVGPLAMHMHYNCANCANFTINVFQLYVNWLKLYLLCSMYAHDKVQLADDMHHVCHDCHLIYYISLSHRHGLQFDTVSVATLFFR